MQYTFFIRFSELEEQGVSRALLGTWFATAKQLCRNESLYVTLNNKLPLKIEDIAAYVSDIYIMPGRDFITVQINTFEEIQNDIITDAYELKQAFKNGVDYDCHLGKFGKYITLTKIKEPAGSYFGRQFLIDE